MQSSSLFIYRENKNFSGGRFITERNFYLLNNSFHKVECYKVSSKQSKTDVLINNLLGYTGGLTSKDEKQILNLLESHFFHVIFIDTSLHGRLAKMIKEKSPNSKIFVFFHNVEKQYFEELLRVTKKIHHKLSIKTAAHNEALACKYADFIVTLNNRDSQLLYKVYERSSDINLPSSFQDKFDSKLVSENNSSNTINLLFVGARFFANEEGIKWFIENVVPNLNPNVKLEIVGKGFEDLKNKWQNEKIDVIGTVDNLDSYYYSADMVISPIFSGGGMKTKVAEALLYGKVIAGTSEAFMGYDIDIEKIGAVCNNVDEFVSYINNFKPFSNKINPNSREAFKKHYNTEMLSKIFKKFINEIL